MARHIHNLDPSNKKVPNGSLFDISIGSQIYEPKTVVPLLLDVTDEEGVQRAVGQVEALLAKRGIKLVGVVF